MSQEFSRSERKPSVRLFYTLAILAFLLMSVTALSQNNKIDSLQRAVSIAKNGHDKTIALSHLAFYYIDVEKDSAYAIAGRAVKIAQQNDDREGLASAYNTLGWCHFIAGNSPKAIPYIKKAIDIYSRDANNAELPRSYCNLATIYIQANKPGEAFDALMKGLRIAEKTGDRVALFMVYKKLGTLYRQIKEPDKAEEILLKAISLASDTAESNNVKMSLANIYLEDGKYKKALTAYNEILVYGKAVGNQYLMALANENIAQVYLAKKMYFEAKKHFYNALDYYTRLGNQADVIYIRMVIAKIEYETGNNDKAVRLFEGSLELAEDIGQVNYQIKILFQLAKLYEASGDHHKALQTYKKAVATENTQNLEFQQAKLDELQTQFETGQKEKEIRILNKDKALQEQKIKLRGTLLLVSGLVILVILLFVAFLISRNRLRQRNKELELRNRIASDLHDDVGSSLSSIRLLSEMVRENKHTSPQMIEKISENIKETIDSMGDIVWMIKPDTKNLSITGLEGRMEKFLSEICAPTGYTFYRENTENTELGMLQKRNIYLIFKEAVNNAVKHSAGNKIDVALTYVNRQLLLSVTDHGSGFQRTEMASGNGLENMEQRARDINGELSLHSENGKGTRVELRLRL